MEIVETRKTVLRSDNKFGAGVGLIAVIQDGELAQITLRLDKHKGSSLPAEWKDFSILGGLNDLKILRGFCEEMISEIERRTTVREADIQTDANRPDWADNTKWISDDDHP